MIIESLLSAPVLTAVGWTLVHFLWQGALIGAAVAVALSLLGDRRAEARYAACIMGLVLMVLAPPLTLIVMLRLPAEPAALPGLLLDASSIVAGPSRLGGLTERLAEMMPPLAVAWLIGVALLQARLVLQWSNAQRLTRRGTGPAPRLCRNAVGELSARLGIRRTVRVLESTIATVPMLIGWLKPVILVPLGMTTGLTPAQVRAVLAHELAHVRRHDYLVNLVQVVLESLLFYHPAVWWLSHRLRIEREYCCDDVAVAVGGGALLYAQALSELDAIRSDNDFGPALASTGGSLMHRIQRLLGVPARPLARGNAWLAPLFITLTLAGAVSALALARPVEPGEGAQSEFPPFGEDAIEHVDLVAVLREVGAPEADLVAVLRDAGMTNEELLILLDRLAPEPRVADALRHATLGERFIKAHLHEVHEHVRDELAAGRITEQEARERMEQAAAEVHRHLEAMARPPLLPPHDADAIHQRMKRLYDEVRLQVEQGLITEEQAHRRLRAAADDLHAQLGIEHLPRAELDAMHGEMRRVHEQVDADLEAGLISQDEAAARIDRAMQKVHDKLRKLVAEDHVVRLRKLHEDIKVKVEAGIITEEEARRQMHDAARELIEAGGVASRAPMSDAEAEFVKQRMFEIHDQVRADLEAGRITETQAAKRLHQAKLELHEAWLHRLHRQTESREGGEDRDHEHAHPH